jgi:four helix bundle protein
MGMTVASRVRMPLRHHTLVAWQRADDLFIELHQVTLKSYPSYEKYELGSQTRRAAFSVAVNIVEGCARRHRDDRLRFLDISRASLAELGYCLHVARRLEYLTSERFAAFEKSLNQLGAALSGFINAVRDGRAL